MSTSKHNWLLWLFFFIVFEVIVFIGLQWLLVDVGLSNQYQAENTIIPNWVKAITFILLYLLCVLVAVLIISNRVPSKYREQLMRWVYLALLGMVVMVVMLF